MINGHMKAYTMFNNNLFDITVEEGENITNFLAKIEKAKNELTNLGDNIFIDDIVMAKVLS
jgi:hypothetical protein